MEKIGGFMCEGNGAYSCKFLLEKKENNKWIQIANDVGNSPFLFPKACIYKFRLDWRSAEIRLKLYIRGGRDKYSQSFLLYPMEKFAHVKAEGTSLSAKIRLINYKSENECINYLKTFK
ncbi:MAG: hypothetical protein LBU66_04125 [Treponema sp.]|jgi:hypothetical protein|nr:hypothetical protein [Treponema sp.]